MKIVIAEKTSPAAIALFREEPGWDVLTADDIKGNLPEHVRDADALVVRSAVQVDAALLAHAQKLRVIGRAGVGVDNIDLDTATKRGIAVMNTPGGNAVAVAEHTLGLMLTMARFLSRADQTTRAGKWEKKSLQGTELRGKTLGIVGLGRVGLEVARRAKAFEMELIAHDPFVSTSVARDLGIAVRDDHDLMLRRAIHVDEVADFEIGAVDGAVDDKGKIERREFLDQPLHNRDRRILMVADAEDDLHGRMVEGAEGFEAFIEPRLGAADRLQDRDRERRRRIQSVTAPESHNPDNRDQQIPGGRSGQSEARAEDEKCQHDTPRPPTGEPVQAA